MKLTVLVDNATLTDSYYLAEPGLSLHIEDAGLRLLFDAGYSDVFLTNARRAGIDLLALDWVALSHGHLDHTWGLDALIRHRVESEHLLRGKERPRLLAHPRAFDSRSAAPLPEIGSLLVRDKLSRQFELVLSREPVRLSESLIWLGEIPRNNDFEHPAPLGLRPDADRDIPDTIPDDTALVHVAADGLTVITGCAHAGVCNTVEHARRVTGMDRVRNIIGGFHLLDAPAARLTATADYLAALHLDALYPCHCTDLAAKIALAARCPVREVGSGLVLTG
ncbi:MBL fold metallo-hydrolase [Pseudodesulfovibrio sp. F-1]|uniref:MBL fold metallo-hydrolase n=1 Tax=Pseudodesulfovibrio alkaliphilus TaxID=2661613 RepID=A0A7K1KMB9_9BACT|nr:MBL fold metallo-hydrolase [Pseudodesulfovibrio alkaliphilus]MUM77236.1 MBL fold metallo-hydrolase [Pseudodesulfovibrio alkaliphilus]